MDNGGININKIETIKLDVPNNQNFCPVLDVYLWEESSDSDKKLLGLTTIQLSEILDSYYKKRKLPADAILEEDESEDDVMELMNQIQEEKKGKFKVGGKQQ